MFMSMGICGSLWGSVGVCGSLWGSMGVYGSLWGSIGVYGGLWGSVGIHSLLEPQVAIRATAVFGTCALASCFSPGGCCLVSSRTLQTHQIRLPPGSAPGLSELEQKLCQHFQRIEIMRNSNRTVPILLTPDMLSSVEDLVVHWRA